MSKTDQQLRLATGRLLAYDEHGATDGTPIFYFHGSPSTRLDFQPRRRISDWPADVIALADHLALARFAVVGYSGGGPYAAVCALKIPERLTHVGIVSGTGPFDEPGLSAAINPVNRRFIQLACTNPWLSRLTLRLMALMVQCWPRRFITQAMVGFPAPDQAVLARPDFQRAFIAVVQEGLRAGPRGAQLDTALMASPWDFRPEDIRVAVHLWHGEVDANAPPAMGHYMAATIPHSQAFFYPGEGHLSLMAKYVEEILNVVAA
jgi:pimeloyl-ACP methyl ester carboxylesterase